jgi:hypothetical protein
MRPPHVIARRDGATFADPVALVKAVAREGSEPRAQTRPCRIHRGIKSPAGFDKALAEITALRRRQIENVIATVACAVISPHTAKSGCGFGISFAAIGTNQKNASRRFFLWDTEIPHNECPAKRRCEKVLNANQRQSIRRLLSNAETVSNLSRQTSAFLNLFRAAHCVQCSNGRSHRSEEPCLRACADRNPQPPPRPTARETLLFGSLSGAARRGSMTARLKSPVTGRYLPGT